MFFVGVNGSTGTAGLGSGISTNVTTITQIGSLNNWEKVIADDRHTLAINANGQLFGWGNNSNGQLGLGPIGSINIPTQIGSSNNWVSDYIVTSSTSTLAINSNNELYAWGANTNSLFGVNTPSFSNLILKIQDVSNVTSLALSDSFSGIVQESVLYFAGFSSNRVFPGTVPVFSRFSPLPSVSNNNNYTQISAGSEYFVTSNSLGEHFIAGNPSSSYINSGLKPVSTTNIKSVKAGGNNSYYLTLDTSNTLSMYMMYGPIYTVQSSVKKFAAGLTKAVFINSSNQLIQYIYSTRGMSQVTGATGSWIDVFAGSLSDSFAALDSTGKLWTWGTNNFGQLGLGDTATRNSPVQVGIQTWSKIAIGKDFMLGINTDGQLWAWGNNSTGQLGAPIGSYSFVPVRVGSLSDWTHVSAGGSHGAAINTDRELWTWGSNNFGQLGNGTTISQTNPVQVGETYFWFDVSAGENFTVGLKAQLII
jgi:alpha-tubulin suppressor-like RCC1 family protein